MYIKVKRPVLRSLPSLSISDTEKKTNPKQPKACADQAKSQQNYPLLIPTVVEVFKIIFSVC